MIDFEYVISACLCGSCCRYDATTCTDEQSLAIYKSGKAIIVCPECLGGLPTPRTPCEIVDGRVVSKDCEDRTSQFIKGAKAVLSLCEFYHIKKAILKDKSPSCGCNFIYDGTFTGTLKQGKGITAALLSENGIEVIAK